jgi:putative ABC transport system substrate-binding protein
MRRRDFITLLGGAAAASPLAAMAQQGQRIRSLGWLCSFRETSPYAKAAIAAFRQGLSALRWVEGNNLRIEARWFTDREPFARDAQELVTLRPDILVAIGGAATQQLLDATRTIPIVFAHQNDPLARNFVATLARPGGNATGFTHLEYQTCAKWLELLKQLAPHVTRVAAIGGGFAGIDGARQLEAIQLVARSLRVEVIPLPVQDAGEIERGIAGFARGLNDGVIVTESVVTAFHHALLVTLAARYRLPAMYFVREFVVDGGLISYAPNEAGQYRGAASYVDRILKGEKPADLPVQQPTRYELVLNLKTAKTLGLDVPPMLLALTDEVIE